MSPYKSTECTLIGLEDILHPWHGGVIEIVVDITRIVCYNTNNKISPRYLQEIVSGMCCRRAEALLERHPSYGVPFAGSGTASFSLRL